MSKSSSTKSILYCCFIGLVALLRDDEEGFNLMSLYSHMGLLTILVFILIEQTLMPVLPISMGFKS